VYVVHEDTTPLDELLPNYISLSEIKQLEGKQNRAAQLIALQSEDLRRLHGSGLMDSFRHMELAKLLVEFYNLQGQCERIKNTPYPRQFASMNTYIVWLLILLLPFGLVNEFEAMGSWFVWLNIPFCVLVSWVFHTLERVGEASENPFEGGPNDTPMHALSRTIEIDLREMLGETELPTPVLPVQDILM
jgi:ion channel-forming bestrophin family protein